MADAPRKITIKLKPVGTKVAVPSAVKPAAPAPAPAAPAPEPTPAPAPAAEPEVVMQDIPLEPIPETPAPAPAAPAEEVPLTPIAETPAPAAEAPADSPAQQAKRQTSRISLPPEMTSQPMNVDTEAPTIKLKPISSTAKEATENPQAAKSKTARIELDQVLGGIQTNTPLSNTTQKTIKLKRAAPAGAAKPSTSAPIAPASAGTTSPGTTSEAPTIKLKRPMTLKKDAPAPVPAEKSADAGLEPLGELEPLEDLSPLPELTASAAPVAESTGAKAFTVVAIIAVAASIIATLILCGLLQKYAASPDGSLATGNTLHSLPFERLF